jgi:hypothetical protein
VVFKRIETGRAVKITEQNRYCCEKVVKTSKKKLKHLADLRQKSHVSSRELTQTHVSSRKLTRTHVSSREFFFFFFFFFFLIFFFQKIDFCKSVLIDSFHLIRKTKIRINSYKHYFYLL